MLLKHGRYSSPIGRNVLLCLQRYKCTFNDFLSCHSFKNIICRFVSAGCTDDQYNACSMLSECLRVRDGLLKLPDCFSQSDINDIILYLSTSQCRVYVGFLCWFLCSFICLHFYISLYAIVQAYTVYFVYDFHNKINIAYSLYFSAMYR